MPMWARMERRKLRMPNLYKVVYDWWRAVRSSLRSRAPVWDREVALSHDNVDLGMRPLDKVGGVADAVRGVRKKTQSILRTHIALHTRSFAKS